MPLMWATGRGFTLLELLVVLVIASLMTLAFPFARDRVVPARKLSLATEQVIGLLRSDRELARREGTTIEFTADRDTSGAWHPPHVAPEISIRWIPATGADTALRFFSDGTATPGKLQLALNQRQQLIRIQALSGRVEREL
jgi:prepilin-type N-terminal cleavage/methylation domain-containing protein